MYLADELLQHTDLGIRTYLWSALTTRLSVHRTRQSTVGDRAFPVAAARTWDYLPCHVTSASSLHVLKPSENAPLPAFFIVIVVQCLRSDSVIIDTLIVQFTYLPLLDIVYHSLLGLFGWYGPSINPYKTVFTSLLWCILYTSEDILFPFNSIAFW